MDTEAIIRNTSLPGGTRTPDGPAGPTIMRRTRVPGLRVRLEPKELRIELRPQTPFRTSASLGESPWHRVEPPSGATVTLTSTSEQTRFVTLSVECEEAGWLPYWTRWTYKTRNAPDIQGGAAVDAQDQLSPDASTLTLLLLPGETREVSLDFAACLDRKPYPESETDPEPYTSPGNFTFDILAVDTQTGEKASDEGHLRLRHPRVTLLDHLPSLYREACNVPDASDAEQTGRSQSDALYAPYTELTFFERFLRGFEDCLMPLQERAATMYRLFDANVAPAECLTWLASWVALALNENWPELKRRQLIQEAVQLYRWRGTRRGLSRYLEIYTGVKPVINDHPFEGMKLGATTLMGKNAVLGGVKPFTFTVAIALPVNTEVSERFIRDIIESEKPAHAAYDLRLTTATGDADNE